MTIGSNQSVNPRAIMSNGCGIVRAVNRSVCPSPNSQSSSSLPSAHSSHYLSAASASAASDTPSRSTSLVTNPVTNTSAAASVSLQGVQRTAHKRPASTLSVASSDSQRSAARRAAPTLATGRRNLRDERGLGSDEVARRRMRRDRNRVAATKCRQKRLTVTSQLQLVCRLLRLLLHST